MTLTRVLQQGSRGNDVREIQKLLIQMGYNLGSYGADGIYGTVTAGMVRDFQKSYGLVVDGAVGPKTYSKLLEVVASISKPKPFQPPSDGATLIPIPDTINERSDKVIIKNTQIYLKDLGYDVVATSVWDKQTQEAVKLFKKDHLGEGIFGVNILISSALTKSQFNQLKTIAYAYRDLKAKGKPIPIPKSQKPPIIMPTPELTSEPLPDGIILEEVKSPMNTNTILIVLAIVGAILAFGGTKRQEEKIEEETIAEIKE